VRQLPSPNPNTTDLEAALASLGTEEQAYVRAAALRLFLDAAADSVTDDDGNLAVFLVEHAEAQVWA